MGQGIDLPAAGHWWKTCYPLSASDKALLGSEGCSLLQREARSPNSLCDLCRHYRGGFPPSWKRWKSRLPFWLRYHSLDRGEDLAPHSLLLWLGGGAIVFSVLLVKEGLFSSVQFSSVAQLVQLFVTPKIIVFNFFCLARLSLPWSFGQTAGLCCGFFPMCVRWHFWAVGFFSSKHGIQQEIHSHVLPWVPRFLVSLPSFRLSEPSYMCFIYIYGFPVAQWKRICLPVWEPQETWFQFLGQKDPLEEDPLFLHGALHGQRSLADYSPWGHKQLDVDWVTKRTHIYNVQGFQLYLRGGLGKSTSSTTSWKKKKSPKDNIWNTKVVTLSIITIKSLVSI